ncbi:MAG: (Fe-S)-binding protein, partial [Oscillospiraceae bacterium]
SCIAQKKSAGKGDLDAVLTFDELQDWLRSEHITLDERDEHCAPRGSARGMAFYLPGGITGGLVTQMGRYKTVSSDGLSRCIGALKSIQHDGISGYFAELYSCGGACVKGPGIRRQDTVPYLFAKDMLLNASVDDQASTEKYDISTTYAPDIVEIKAPTDSEINAILSKMVAATGGGLLNCGSCGYPTCRQKAIAIYQGKADMDMCLPYMRQRAESMSNVILEYTPNAVFLVDEDYKILQHNPAADRLFSRHGKSMVGEPINNYLHLSGFEKLKTGGKPIIEELSTTVTCNLTVSQSILAVPHGDILVILKDVTAEQENLAAIQKLRVETLNVTQTIIDKQMRSAQEIASLLGETTGETKAALIKLKKALKEGTTL